MTSPDDYTAIHAGAAIGAIAARGQVAVAGPDRGAFLHGLLTNDTASLTAGTGCYAAWLTPQGRMLCDLHVLESGDMIVLDVPAAETQHVADRLEQFHFSEDVQMATLASLRPVWIHGPAAPGMVGGGVGAWRPYQNARIEFAGVSVVIARIDQLGVPGVVIYVDAQQEDEVLAALASRGALHATPATLEAARIEAGYPVFGLDMTADTIPLEAGIEERAISLTKGCYVGQEVIIRVLHRGHGRVARRLVRLQVEGDAPPRDSKIFSAEREIGFVTSAAESPRLGALALGYVHRDFVEPGTAVEVQAGEIRARAVVSSRS
ncbi:MAG TPA: glycine cleavage T C-terminal barrel domain-containing protein [Vicinamibacterales bacterium]|jgi:folate-binding protein YgfZ|nr:glycine cleavage T C-terminal barrel domain-containing protein [Vicinamibacterales bacterium]